MQAVARLSGTETVAISLRRGNSLSKGFCAAAHPSTIEEHTKLGDAARAQSINRDTSDDFLQEETEHRAKTALNIVFVTSEVNLKLAVAPTRQALSQQMFKHNPSQSGAVYTIGCLFDTLPTQKSSLHSGSAMVQDRRPG